MLLQLAARQMLRQATAEGTFSTLPCVYVSLQLDTSRHAGRQAGRQAAILQHWHSTESFPCVESQGIYVSAASREMKRTWKLRMRRPSAEHPWPCQQMP